eukprot:CAMPEP_0206420008 /NCGR_PEP_ID=MMETSP0324_2-20121206/542_1 /ASSEMBLY_ACC=CAM_ASM_000836 /TAXON_ID=2866 /ORGANISM="Crypthecodinium cohnii, Strain Seligo" /LENGTH=296 /DNA_ID=CAMNT_0053883721 /DNA_START=67 /DNA_END=954 /DNA_ORIENTATION=+
MGNNLVFHPPDCSYHPKEYEGELLWVPRAEDGYGDADEHMLPCFLLQCSSATHLMIFFHANAEDLGQIYVMLRYFRTFLGVHVLAVEYGGYGLCSGTSSERRLLTDADTVMDFVQQELEVSPENVLVVGRSIGGCPAIHLASTYPVAGLVTMSTFSRIADVVNVGQATSMFLGLVFDRFDNLRRIRSVQCPTLIIHGNEDTVVSVDHAYDLLDECGSDYDGDNGNIAIREGRGHNDLEPKEDVIGPILEVWPDLRSGEQLDLPGVEDMLLYQPKRLAPDVISRLPYSPNWVPHMLP